MWKKKAKSLGIKGYVENKTDGSVFVDAEGNVAALENLAKFCQIGTQQSKVIRVQKIQRPIENLKGFRIVY